MRARRCAVALGVMLALAGCAEASSPTPSPTTSGTPATSATTPARTSPPVPAAPEATSPAAEPDASTAPLAAPTAVDAAAATALAESFMRGYVRKDLEQAAWFAGIRDMLTDQARAGYSFSVPRTITATTTAPASAVIPAEDGTITVTVPTDAGDYQVLIVDGAGHWQVARAIPPADIR